ncbi:uncharacterized protein RMCC_3689 [Mycolicibacterium canariasense]|uniref:DUF305 domain-containing protein n=1 Tax=Mycolicibacterium canariasense TaxID=228230 RepID=A0A117IAN9_MYCCR|nr:DUF305 domain-containing protein [Mycolicibacterium canariasense]MCV7210031.1 DUF305 domain-containing protein [Mycolicibacterium canariasense]ORV04689.1 DUF305 domain-containing protein [Mycolicibacterium canariasense]GAS96723.1 uncharacterized protein RMCC_3689 [Mycolicibacterium canariasense]
MKKAAAAIAAAVAVLVVGCSNQSGATEEADHSGHQSSAPAAGSTSATADATAHNDADVMFAQMMIPHHTQAVEMSDILLAKQGVDPRVVQLATEIKAAQAPEIAQMQGWLTSWGSPAMAPMDHGMQGMVSPQDIDTLRNAPGPAAAKLYVTQMIAHHEGAIAMAQDEIAKGQYGPAIELSHAIVDTQQKEIDTMKAMLATL